jgi:hypothetical protein
MKLSTNSVESSAERLMSTGSGSFAGSPTSPISSASKLPSGLRNTPQSFEVSAVEVKAYSWRGCSAQRISSGAPGTASVWSGFRAWKSHTTMVLPKCFMASASPISSESFRM